MGSQAERVTGEGPRERVEDRATCLRQVEQTERIRQKASAPVSLQNVPDTFCWTLTMRRSRSA